MRHLALIVAASLLAVACGAAGQEGEVVTGAGQAETQARLTPGPFDRQTALGCDREPGDDWGADASGGEPMMFYGRHPVWFEFEPGALAPSGGLGVREIEVLPTRTVVGRTEIEIDPAVVADAEVVVVGDEAEVPERVLRTAPLIAQQGVNASAAGYRVVFAARPDDDDPTLANSWGAVALSPDGSELVLIQRCSEGKMMESWYRWADSVVAAGEFASPGVLFEHLRDPVEGRALMDRWGEVFSAEDDARLGPPWEERQPWERSILDSDVPAELRAGAPTLSIDVVVPESWRDLEDVVKICTRMSVAWGNCFRPSNDGLFGSDNVVGLLAVADPELAVVATAGNYAPDRLFVELARVTPPDGAEGSEVVVELAPISVTTLAELAALDGPLGAQR